MDDGAGSSGGLFSRLFKNSRKKDGESVTEDEILSILNADDADDIGEGQREMINNIFEFDDLEVSDVMTHRTDICAVEINSSLSEAVSVIIENGVSRIPVYEDNIDNICGALYAKDLLTLIFDKNPEEHTISEFLREINFVPETNHCFELFESFTSQKTQMAVAVDEYGGTAGLVTMEDLLEAIVGNIQDEYDNETEDIIKISDGIYEVMGWADTDDAAKEIGFSVPEGSDYDTIGGFVISLLGRIPDGGECPQVEFNGYRFKVKSVGDKRIEKLEISKMDK